jgi:hypothetical protein
MKQRTLRAFALLPCAALILGASALQASTVKSDRFEIPFAFQVQNHKTLPAGEYQVQQAPGSELAILVNRKTGESFRFIRPWPRPADKEGKFRLKFRNTEEGHVLKQIS